MCDNVDTNGGPLYLPVVQDGVSDQWYLDLCRPRVQPPPVPDTVAAQFARSVRYKTRVLRTEGVPARLAFSEVTDTTFTVEAQNEGSPLGTDMYFSQIPATGYIPPNAGGGGGGQLLALRGGPGQVSETLRWLTPNSRYRFTVAAHYRYTDAETLRTYTPRDLRGYPVTYTIWTHGPAAPQITAGRMLRFTPSAYNAERPGVQSGGTGPPAAAYEAVFYFVEFANLAEATVAVVGPFAAGNNTVYAPPELPSGDYQCVIESVYTFNGEFGGESYSSEPFAMNF